MIRVAVCGFVLKLIAEKDTQVRRIGELEALQARLCFCHPCSTPPHPLAPVSSPDLCVSDPGIETAVPLTRARVRLAAGASRSFVTHLAHSLHAAIAHRG